MANFVPVAEVATEEFKPVAEVEGEFKPVAEVETPPALTTVSEFIVQPETAPSVGSPLTPAVTQTSTAPTISPVPATEQEAIAIQAEGKPVVEIGATPATLPRFGKEGTLMRGVANVLGGLGEWALNRPEEALATLTPLGPAIAARYAPEMAQQWGENLLKGLKGNKEALGEALTMAAAVGLPIGAKKAYDTWRISGPSRVQPTPPEQVALEATRPTLLPRSEAELAKPSIKETYAVSQRKAETLPVDAPPSDSAQVGAQVREQVQAEKAPQEAVAPAKAATPEAATPISVGPGAASPGDVPKGSQLSQLTEAIRGAAPVKRSMIEAVRSELSTTKEQIGQMATSALNNLRALGQDAMNRLQGVTEWTGFRDTLGKFSGAINRNDYELLRFTHDIRRSVPNPLRRQAIVNFLQADGDAAMLNERAAASKGTLKRGYELANQLTPDEKLVAGHVRSYLDAKLQEGMEAGLLNAGIENYVTQLWKRPNPITNKLMGEAASGKLNTNFRYARQRIFNSYFEGEQTGYTPRIKDIGALVAAYDQAFSRAIASRNFVKAMHEGTASDGRPLVEISGFAHDLGEKGGSALLLKPRAKPEELQGYRPIDHPAMRGWKWAGTDQNGNPILFQGDMLAHPEIYAHLRNVLSTSAMRRNAFMSALMKGQAFLKQSKLSLSGFHFTQEAAHGAAHRVNPLAPIKIDFAQPDQAALTDHGLQISDYRAYSAFAEGLSGAGGLYEKIPGIGKWLTHYNEYLFQEYIPRLKMTMALDALDRNRARYSKTLSDDQILDLTARQANAAFGEQNYAMLGRNPTFQDFLRLAFLAPDFLEARARFMGQALTVYGKEQRIALALQAATLYAGARLLNTAISGDPHWDIKDAFEIFAGKRRFGIRTVVEDAMHAVSDSAQFLAARLSSTVRIAQEFATGRDWRGIKRTSLEQFADIARWLVPITVDQPAIRTRADSLLASAGVTVRSATAQQKVYELLRNFREKNNLLAPADKAGSITPSEYGPLRNALLAGNEKDARDAYLALLRPGGAVKAKTPQQVRDHFSKAVTAPFSGSNAVEARFRASLDSKGRQAYMEARRERQQELSRLLQWQHRWR